MRLLLTWAGLLLSVIVAAVVGFWLLSDLPIHLGFVYVHFTWGYRQTLEYTVRYSLPGLALEIVLLVASVRIFLHLWQSLPQ